jgi:hypothetical protein
MMNARLDVSEIAKEWMKDPAFKAEYDALEEEFSAAAARICSRTLDTDASEDCHGGEDAAVGRD